MHDGLLMVQHPEGYARQILFGDFQFLNLQRGHVTLAASDLFLTYVDMCLSENNTFLVI